MSSGSVIPAEGISCAKVWRWVIPVFWGPGEEVKGFLPLEEMGSWADVTAGERRSGTEEPPPRPYSSPASKSGPRRPCLPGRRTALPAAQRPLWPRRHDTGLGRRGQCRASPHRDPQKLSRPSAEPMVPSSAGVDRGADAGAAARTASPDPDPLAGGRPSQGLGLDRGTGGIAEVEQGYTGSAERLGA